MTQSPHSLKPPKKSKAPHKSITQIPDDSISTAADGHDRRPVLGGDLEEVAKDVVLYKLASVG